MSLLLLVLLPLGFAGVLVGIFHHATREFRQNRENARAIASRLAAHYGGSRVRAEARAQVVPTQVLGVAVELRVSLGAPVVRVFVRHNLYLGVVRALVLPRAPGGRELADYVGSVVIEANAEHTRLVWADGLDEVRAGALMAQLPKDLGPRLARCGARASMVLEAQGVTFGSLPAPESDADLPEFEEALAPMLSLARELGERAMPQG